jgi:hypothetical protein
MIEPSKYAFLTLTRRPTGIRGGGGSGIGEGCCSCGCCGTTCFDCDCCGIEGNCCHYRCCKKD